MAGDAWQGTGTWHEQACASEKIDSFPGRLLFLGAFLKFYVRFVCVDNYCIFAIDKVFQDAQSVK